MSHFIKIACTAKERISRQDIPFILMPTPRIACIVSTRAISELYYRSNLSKYGALNTEFRRTVPMSIFSPHKMLTPVAMNRLAELRNGMHY